MYQYIIWLFYHQSIGAYKYLEELWRKIESDLMTFILRVKTGNSLLSLESITQPGLIKVEDSAIRPRMVRVRVRRGGRKTCPKRHRVWKTRLRGYQPAQAQQKSQKQGRRESWPSTKRIQSSQQLLDCPRWRPSLLIAVPYGLFSKKDVKIANWNHSFIKIFPGEGIPRICSISHKSAQHWSIHNISFDIEFPTTTRIRSCSWYNLLAYWWLYFSLFLAFLKSSSGFFGRRVLASHTKASLHKEFYLKSIESSFWNILIFYICRKQ